MAKKQVGATPSLPEDAVTKDYTDDGLATKANKTGDTFTGQVNVAGADFVVSGEGKAYRFRRGGSGLDYEGGGADLVFSMWPNADFSGEQFWYDRFTSWEARAFHTGRREFTSTLFGGTVRHVIDPVANTTGWYGATPVGRQTVTGTRGGNPGVASALSGLAALGWIDNQTTTGETLAVNARTANYTLTAADQLVTFSGNNLTATLPAHGSVPVGTTLRIKNLATQNLTVSGTIDGGSSLTLAQWAKATVVATAARWITI